MSKEVFYEDKNFRIVVEPYEGNLVVHCSVTRWTHSVLKKLYKEFVRLVEISEERGYKGLDAYSPNPKFCELLCFDYVGIDFMYDDKLHSHYRYELGGE